MARSSGPAARGRRRPGRFATCQTIETRVPFSAPPRHPPRHPPPSDAWRTRPRRSPPPPPRPARVPGTAPRAPRRTPPRRLICCQTAAKKTRARHRLERRRRRSGRSLWRTSSAALARSPGDPRLTDWLLRRYASRFLRRAARRARAIWPRRRLVLLSTFAACFCGTARRRCPRPTTCLFFRSTGSARRSFLVRGCRVCTPRARVRARDVGVGRTRVHHSGVVADGFLPRAQRGSRVRRRRVVVDRPPLASAASNLASSSEATLVSTVTGTLLARGAAGVRGVCWTTTDDASSFDRSGRLGNGGGLFGRGSREGSSLPACTAFGAASGTSTASSKEKVTWSSRLAAAVDVAALAALCPR